jgi:CCR4-NOT complex subunit CAF16
MRFGAFVQRPISWPPTEGAKPGTLLYDVALQWLADDRAYRRELEKKGKKVRGARRDQTVPTDSETFYKKYDHTKRYNHVYSIASFTDTTTRINLDITITR